MAHADETRFRGVGQGFFNRIGHASINTGKKA
jgi:hypothetical protein